MEDLIPGTTSSYNSSSDLLACLLSLVPSLVTALQFLLFRDSKFHISNAKRIERLYHSSYSQQGKQKCLFILLAVLIVLIISMTRFKAREEADHPSRIIRH